jgi:hypothetical protein
MAMVGIEVMLSFDVGLRAESSKYVVSIRRMRPRQREVTDNNTVYLEQILQQS